MPSLTFAYDLRLMDAEELHAELRGRDDAATSVFATRLATGSHIAAWEVASIGVRGEDDLLEHDGVVWLARGADAHVGAEASARRLLDAFLRDLRTADLADSHFEDVWPQDAQVTVDPLIEIRLGQRGGPTPEYLRSLVADAVRQIRKERRLSQKELAAAIGLRAQHIAAVERRRGPLNLAHLASIASGLDVAVSEVFRRAEEGRR